MIAYYLLLIIYCLLFIAYYMSLPQKVKNIRFHEESLADKVCKSGPNLMFHSDSINWYQYFENADKEEKVKKEERVENNTI